MTLSQRRAHLLIWLILTPVLVSLIGFAVSGRAPIRSLNPDATTARSGGAAPAGEVAP